MSGKSQQNKKSAGHLIHHHDPKQNQIDQQSAPACSYLWNYNCNVNQLPHTVNHRAPEELAEGSGRGKEQQGEEERQ